MAAGVALADTLDSSLDRIPLPALFAKLIIVTGCLVSKRTQSQVYYVPHLINIVRKTRLMSWGVSVSITKYHRLASLHKRNLFYHPNRKSKVKVVEDSVSGKSP